MLQMAQNMSYNVSIRLDMKNKKYKTYVCCFNNEENFVIHIITLFFEKLRGQFEEDRF